jgi:glycosyltransferase involved in cell wall biosynthesis
VNKALSVVVPTYNRREMLPGLITRLLENPATHEIVVVVDGSRDGSIELLGKMRQSDQRVIPITTENFGADPARRTEVAAATGDDAYNQGKDLIRRLAWRGPSGEEITLH